MGEHIRARRVEMKKSQSDLAEALGVTFQQIQKYEKGINRVNATRLGTIAKVLDVKVEVFFRKDAAADVTSLIDVTDKETLRMLVAYSRIRDQATQRQMVALIETIAAAQDA